MIPAPHTVDEHPVPLKSVPLGVRDAGWAAACGLLLAAQFLPADWRPGVPDDTRSTAPGGKKAFVLLADREGFETSRSERPLPDLLSELNPRTDVLAALGPARTPNEAEREALRDWWADGGGLLWAARPGQAIDFAPLGEIEASEGGGGSNSADDPADFALSAGLDPTRWELFWPHAGTVTGAGGGDVLVECGGAVRAAAAPGRTGGAAALVAGDAIFTNESLAWGDNGALAFRLLEEAAVVPNGPSRTRVIFDESLNVTGTPKVVALLLDPELRPLTLHLALIAVLWAWWRGRAFGPPLPDPAPPRRTLTDHTDAAGDLAWRTGDGAGALAWYRRAVAHDLRLPGGAGREGARARAVRIAALARTSGRDAAEVKALLQRAAKPIPRGPGNAGRRGSLGRRAAAALIRDLAELRAAIVAGRSGLGGRPK